MSYEFRLNGELTTNKKRIEGYAFKFNVWGHPINNSFVEKILPSAISNDFLKSQDVYALLNHDKNKVLARSYKGKGSLTLNVDNVGLYYSFPVKKNEMCQMVMEYIEDGEIWESSYAFSVEDSGEKWRKRDDGLYERTITKFQSIGDVSPVWNGQNINTTATTRYFIDNVKKETIKEDGLYTKIAKLKNSELENDFANLSDLEAQKIYRDILSKKTNETIGTKKKFTDSEFKEYYKNMSLKYLGKEIILK